MSSRCRAQFKKAAGTKFTDEEIDGYIDRMRAKRRNMGDDSAKAIRDILSEMSREEMYEYLRRKALDAQNKRAAALRSTALQGIAARSWTERIRAFTVGRNRDEAGGHRGLDQISRGRAAQVKRDLMAELKAAGVDGRFRQAIFGRTDRKFDEDLFIEISRHNGADAAETGNADAVTAAPIIAKYVEDLRRLNNSFGADIRKLDGYVSPQGHDALKVAGGYVKGMGASGRDVAMNRWVEFIKTRLDPVTFEGVKDKDQFLRQIWANIVSGNHERVTGQSLDGALADIAPPVGQSALANRLGRSRVLHFKTPQDALAYHAEFGTGTTMGNVLRHIEHATKNATLLEYMGPNPDNTFKQLMAFAREQTPPENQVDSVLKPKRRQAEWDELTGVNLSGSNVRFAAFTSALKTFQVVTKLGGMVLSAISDVSLASSTLMRAGVPMGEAYKGAIAGILRIGDNKLRRQVADDVGMAINVMTGSNVARFAVTDGAGGFLARAQQRFYKLNLFDTYQTGLRQGVGYVYARQLGRMAERHWDKLPADMRNTLEAYGIDRFIWQSVSPHKIDLDGRTVLTSEAVRDVDDAKAAQWAQANGYGDSADAGRREMALRMDMMFMDIADRALTEPKAYERALLRFGTKGDAARAMSVLMQFKSFPIAVLTQHINPAIAGTGQGRPIAQTAHLIAATWFMGLIAHQTKQIAAGKTPKELTDEDGNVNTDLLLQALLQGGGLGIYGDFVLKDQNSYGQSLTATALGPSAGTAETLLGLVQSPFTASDSETPLENFNKESVKALRGNIPFGNLFYTRAALDYAVLYHLQEMADPGSLSDRERRLKNRTGQEYFIPPSDVAGE